MNFLAHLFLSGDDEDIIMGNMIADFIRNKEVDNYSLDVQKGIQLHRNIDHYTDNHTEVRKGTERLRPHHRKYSPVVIDLFYDHLLVKNWERYTDEGLDDFCNRMYKILNDRMGVMPTRLARRLPLMIEDNWLTKYGTEEGMLFVLKKMDQRTKFPSDFAAGVAHLKDGFENFNAEFNTFFPEVIDYVDVQITLQSED